jgi:hypothetical protein
MTVKEKIMRITLAVLAILFLFISCDDGKSNLQDEDVLVDIDFNVDSEIDDSETQDEDKVIEERSPEGISTSSGTGVISSSSYKMDLTVGKLFSGQVMKSESYKLEIVVK